MISKNLRPNLQKLVEQNRSMTANNLTDDEKEEFLNENQANNGIQSAPSSSLTLIQIFAFVLFIFVIIMMVILAINGNDDDNSSDETEADLYDKLLDGEELTESEKMEMYIWIEEQTTKYVPSSIKKN